MYLKITLQHIVRIPPSKFGSNIRDAAFEILSEQFNGQIYENIGFIISVIVTIPILILSPLIQEFLGFELTFFASDYVLFLLREPIKFINYMKNLGIKIKMYT